MELLIAFGTFVTVTLCVFGLGYKTTGNGAMDVRLGGLRYAKPRREALPDPDAAFTQRVLRPLAAALTRRANSLLPSEIADRLADSLERAGIKIPPGQFIIFCGVLIGGLPILTVVIMGSALPPMQLMLVALVAGVLGFYIPRMMVLGRIKRRQDEIRRALPDAFDLVTALVEAGLGIDQALAHVIDKVEGPFAVELQKTTKEISMGRTRSDAFRDMADRAGVDELRSLVNAIIQAEQMGISVGGVIRIQTDVMRTKRRQRAEEQAYQAPIKMTLPLVFFVFPAIFAVIGGPAVIQIKDGF